MTDLRLIFWTSLPKNYRRLKYLERRLSCSVLPEEKNSLLGFQGITRGITQIKKAERELLLAEKLSATGKLARTVAHEVRNPLTNINLALEQLRDELPKGHPNFKEQEIYLDIIQRNTSRIDRLIGELLNSSKTSALNLGKRSLVQVIEEVLMLASDRIKLNGLEVKTQFEEDIPQLRIDPEKMKIALLNIFINAIEVMEPQKGLLSIRLSRQEHFICIEIRDNGLGIAEEGIPRLFEPFFTGKKKASDWDSHRPKISWTAIREKSK